MKTLVIKEFGDFSVPGAHVVDLCNTVFQNCVGCWTCWWKTPGVCIHNDMEDFYRSYVGADNVIIFAKLEYGFVSSKLKTVLDRMIPLFLPYTFAAKGGSWHTPRYEKYPDIVFCYDYDFQDDEEYQLLHDYIYRVFEQFFSKEIKICHISEFQEDLS